MTLFANVVKGILLDIKTLLFVPQKKRHTSRHSTPSTKIRFGDENGISYLYGMKGLFGEKILEKFEYKQLDSTEIVKVKCAECSKEYVLFDSRFHGYDATIPERESKYDSVVYDFTPIIWKKDKDGLATFTIKIQNDDGLEDFIENAYETDEETYSNSFGWIMIKATKTTKQKQKRFCLIWKYCEV